MKHRLRLIGSLTLALVLALGLHSSEVLAKKDKDNNPPGPAGGKGTNWENPPGPQGGPGASPNTSQAAWLREGADANHDSMVDNVEKKLAHDRWVASHSQRDKDNNPPGPKGGKGTNWENPPGPQGGPGASPDKKYYGNPPGPVGGPGAGPKWDKDNNPPGPKGGRGTNWENPPGPKGGAGASPNKKK